MPKARHKHRTSGRRRPAKPKRAIKAARRPRRLTRAHPGRRRRPQPKAHVKVVDPRVAQALKEYARAMKHFNQHKYRRARPLLEKLLQAPSRELAERARVHLNICERRLQRPAAPRFRTGDDYYNYGVSLTNLQRYDEAHTALLKARKRLPKADYVYYALASLAALVGETDEALENLRHALRLRPESRFHARNDPDLKSLEGDPHFFELVYPERTVSV